MRSLLRALYTTRCGIPSGLVGVSAVVVAHQQSMYGLAGFLGRWSETACSSFYRSQYE
ncbi:hypothetical protein BaRGS_00004635, partial [Batillaria attramentaria]